MTIAALASPPGSVARAVVRLSGPGVVDALRALCVGIDDAALRTRGVHRVVLDLHASNRCPALCVRTLAGASFTGEDCCELLVAGGPHVPAMVLSRVLSLDGVRQAHAGEFAARAYLAGRLTPAQAEGIAATIAARAGAQLAAAARLREGTTGAMFVQWRDEVLHLLALVEAGIDFTDQEDVTPIAPHALRARVQEVRDAIAHELGGAGRAEPGGEPLVSLVGAPNAGKSTLFNALLGRERAVASPAPGTTRDVLRERLDLSADLAPGMGVLLHDLAGLDASVLADQHSPDTAHTADAAAQHAARAAAKASDVLLWCDPTGAFDEPALHALLGFAPRVAGVLRVRTCADRVAHADLPDGGAIPVCALDGWNLAPLRRAIADRAHHAHDDSLWSLLPRHARALREAHDALDHVARAVAQAPSIRAISPEILAEHLRTALTALGEVSGELSPDDVLGKVFATFCVGK